MFQKNIKQFVPQDLESTFKSFWINLDRVTRLFKENILELMNLDNSLQETKAILTNNNKNNLFEFDIPFSTLSPRYVSLKFFLTYLFCRSHI